MISTVYPKEKTVLNFFQDCSPYIDALNDKTRTINSFERKVIIACKALHMIKSITPVKLISHLPLLLDFLLSLLSSTREFFDIFKEEIQKDMEKQKQEELKNLEKKKKINQEGLESKRRRSETTVDTKDRISATTKSIFQKKTQSNSEIQTPGKRMSFIQDFGRRLSVRLSFLNKTPQSVIEIPLSDVKDTPEEEEKSFSQNMKEIEKEIMETILCILRGINDQEEYDRNNKLILSYSQYIFKDITINEQYPIYMTLTEHWLIILKESKDEIINDPKKKSSTPKITNTLVKNSFQFSYFFFDLICKSYALNPPLNSKPFIKILTKLMKEITLKLYPYKNHNIFKNLVKFTIQQMALFLIDLSYIISYASIAEVIDIFFKTIRSKSENEKSEFIYNTIQMESTFIKVFINHDQFIALNNPKYILKEHECLSSPPIRILIEILKDIFIFDMTKEESKDEKSNILSQYYHSEVHKEASELLQYIMCKHELDERYQMKKDILSRIYFPFIILLLNHEFEKIMEHEMYIQFIFFILNNLNDEFFKNWTMELKEILLVKLLKILTISLKNETIKRTKKQSALILNTLTIKFSNLFLSNRDRILPLPIQFVGLDEARESKTSNALELSIFMISLIIKKDNDLNLGVCEKYQPFHEILKLLVKIEKK